MWLVYTVLLYFQEMYRLRYVVRHGFVPRNLHHCGLGAFVDHYTGAGEKENEGVTGISTEQEKLRSGGNRSRHFDAVVLLEPLSSSLSVAGSEDT